MTGVILTPGRPVTDDAGRVTGHRISRSGNAGGIGCPVLLSMDGEGGHAVWLVRDGRARPVMTTADPIAAGAAYDRRVNG